MRVLKLQHAEIRERGTMVLADALIENRCVQGQRLCVLSRFLVRCARRCWEEEREFTHAQGFRVHTPV